MCGIKKRVSFHVSRHSWAVLALDCAVGFGISTPEQAKQMAAISDGAIVGSAIVKLIAEHGTEAAPYLYQYVKEMKEAVESV